MSLLLEPLKIRDVVLRNHGRTLLFLTFLMLAGGVSHAASVAFTPRELFRIPFGTGKEFLGARIKDSNFVIPREFTLDGAGHFYIYDTNKHRIARFSSEGKYEIGFNYPETARQVFAHADSKQNLWLLISDPVRGIYYGVYDPRGKRLWEGIFSQFNQFRLHLDDDHILHVILSSPNGARTETFIFHEDSLLMKKEAIGPPPETHHQLHQGSRQYFIDAIPGASPDGAHTRNRITDDAHHGVAEIQGTVVYITDLGEVYTRRGDRRIYVYDVGGTLKGKVSLTGLPSACASVRFDSDGNIYELDGIPDQKGQYTPEMSGMRLIVWERH